jgi:hypothetical protein
VVYLFNKRDANKKIKTSDAPSLYNGKVMLKKQDKNSMQTEELIGQGVGHGASLSLWYYPLLFPTSFLEWLILEGTKII